MDADQLEPRDILAMLIVAGMYANPNHSYNNHYSDAHEAYSMADALLKVRENGQN